MENKENDSQIEDRISGLAFLIGSGDLLALPHYKVTLSFHRNMNDCFNLA